MYLAVTPEPCSMPSLKRGTLPPPVCMVKAKLLVLDAPDANHSIKTSFVALEKNFDAIHQIKFSSMLYIDIGSF